MAICVGLVAGAEPLAPIAWRVWAGKAEREGGGAYAGLEERGGFVDIRVCLSPFQSDWGQVMGVLEGGWCCQREIKLTVVFTEKAEGVC